jgi:hypothetical protein
VSRFSLTEQIARQGAITTYEKVKGHWIERVPYAPPEVYAPLVRAEKLLLDVARTKGGKVKALTAYRADGSTEYALPAGAKSMVRTLLTRENSAEIGLAYPEVIVTYARGYAVGANGEMVRKPIWEARTPDEAEDGKDRRTRVQVGSEDPQPVDSILVRGVWRSAEQRVRRVLGGYWTDGKHDTAIDWRWDSPTQHLSATQLSHRLKEM